MSKRASTLETLTIALMVLKRLPKKGYISVKDLHQQLLDADIKRDIRSIQRLLKEMAEQGLIDRDDSSSQFGYRALGSQTGMLASEMEPQEALLLMLATRLRHGLLKIRAISPCVCQLIKRLPFPEKIFCSDTKFSVMY